MENRYYAAIYSLGVCLLEIGLGESLIVLNDEDSSNLCELFQKAAIKMPFVSLENANNACKNMKPRELAKVLCGLSEAELPSRKGPHYLPIVQQCLRCIERGFGPIQDFVKNQDYEVNPVFQEIVLEHLERFELDLGRT